VLICCFVGGRGPIQKIPKGWNKMIRIISRKAFRFFNPSQKLVNSYETVNGEGEKIVIQELAIPAAVTVGKEEMTAELFFDTKPGEFGKFGDPQDAPECIRAMTPDRQNFHTFKNATKHGDLIVVEGAVAINPEKVADAPKAEAVAPKPGEPLQMPVVDSSAPLPADDSAQAVAVGAPDPPSRPLAGGRAKRNPNP